MAQLSDPERLRLAVAIAVLRSKPRDISLPAYILSLHPLFPPSGPAPPTADYRWKTYALKLESDLEQLREKYAAQKTELLALSSNGAPELSTHSVSLVLEPPADAIKKKAKSKKTPGTSDAKAAPDLGIFHQIDYQIPRSGELLLALRAFGKVISGNNNDASTLLHSTLRVIQIASRILTPIINQPSSKTSNPVTVSVLGKILSHTIKSSLSSMKVQRLSTTSALVLSDIDKVFDALIECIFGPIILAFARITRASLSSLLGESSFGPGSPPNVEEPSLVFDLRQDLLRFFKVLVDDLCSVSLSAHNQGPSNFCQWTISLSSLKACLNLEIIRELGKVLFPVAQPSAANGSDTELGNELWNHQGAHAVSRAVPLTVPASASLASSVASVVAKDVLWYLCSLMHILADLPEGFKLDSEVFPPGAPQDSHSPPRPNLDQHENKTALLELLHDTVLSSLYDLVLRCQSVIDYDERPCSECDTADGMHRSDRTHIGNSLTVYRNHARREDGLSNGDRESAQNSQAQGQLSFPGDNQSEVGNPGGLGLRDRLDDINCVVLTAEYDTDFSSHQTSAERAANRTAEVDMPPVDASGDCAIDEAGFMMLLGVVERFIVGSGYTRW